MPDGKLEFAVFLGGVKKYPFSEGDGNTASLQSVFEVMVVNDYSSAHRVRDASNIACLNDFTIIHTNSPITDPNMLAQSQPSPDTLPILLPDSLSATEEAPEHNHPAKQGTGRAPQSKDYPWRDFSWEAYSNQKCAEGLEWVCCIWYSHLGYRCHWLKPRELCTTKACCGKGGGRKSG